jgi:hypothetical protein
MQYFFSTSEGLWIGNTFALEERSDVYFWDEPFGRCGMMISRRP